MSFEYDRRKRSKKEEKVLKTSFSSIELSQSFIYDKSLCYRTVSLEIKLAPGPFSEELSSTMQRKRKWRRFLCFAQP